MSNYATKTDLNKATGADTSNLAAKSDWTSLNVEIDQKDVNELKNTPVDLTLLSLDYFTPV